MLVTYLEPACARRLFSCFDEPEFRATFELTIKHRLQNTALSNMPIIKRGKSNGHAVTTYERTPMMSSYLLSLVVGEFGFIGGALKRDGTQISIYAPVGLDIKISDMIWKAI